MTVERMLAEFISWSQRDPRAIARAPGRVNLLGEHTDYNDGFVLPIAIEQSTWAACADRADGIVRVHSASMNQDASWALAAWEPNAQPNWTRYIAGLVEMFRRRNARLSGFDLLIDSAVGPGSGLSSSAALEVSVALALAHLFGEPLVAQECVDLCRAAEHEFGGVPCGIMDQTASLLGKAGCALRIDCRSRLVEHVALPFAEHTLLVVDSGVRHELATSEYAKRLRECTEATAYFSARNSAVRALRDVSTADVRRHATQMDPLAAARALHVTSENERVLAGIAALRARKLHEFGQLMLASHRSLRDDYQVSCRELDRIVNALMAAPGVIGARMTGAGFGGCVVALVERAAQAGAVEAVRSAYGADTLVTEVQAGAGASLVLG